MRILLTITFSLACFALFAQKDNHSCRYLKNKAHYFTEKATANADSVHVVHYDIHIDSVVFSVGSLWARTGILARSKVDGLTHIQLDLQNMTVDSVTLGVGNTLSHTHTGTSLDITIPTTDLNETVEFTVHYHGQPGQDPSWGGFYWQGTSYAYNMGVGFDEDPHVYGRAWYPCLDVFTDRSTYDFHITIDSTYMPVCNGELVGQPDLGDGRMITHWSMDQPIPSYLSAISIAHYLLLEREYSGIPAVFACLPSDTSNVISTFSNMQTCVDRFVDSYGPYRFNRIGYSLVPFNGGAMEHASSIHIGKAFIDGSLNYETLWAHELAHMWWGDNVTCASAEDMWLNEGWAVFSEGIFIESVYGENAYMDWYRALHRDMLQFAHIIDGDYYEMNNIPHSITYGSHVYEKGPLMCHSLRGYMGDSLFFEACKAYHDSLTMGNASSLDLQNIFTASSGVDMSGIFNGFIFEPGWGHFSVDSFSTIQISNEYQISVDLRQRSRANNHLYQMKVPVFFADGLGNDTTLWMPMDQEVQSFSVVIDFEPLMAIVDGKEELSDAMADLMLSIETPGLYNFTHTNVKLDVSNAGQGTSIIRVADNFVAPYPPIITVPESQMVASTYHYWSIEGIMSQDFEASAEFKYYGTSNNSNGYMDNDLFVNDDNEQNLKMFYRLGAGYEWAELDTMNYEVITGSNTTNARGEIEVYSVALGEYQLVMSDPSVGIRKTQNSEISIGPNPVRDQISINLNSTGNDDMVIRVFDASGRSVYERKLYQNSRLAPITVETNTWETGTYIIRINDAEREFYNGKVEVIR